MTTKMVWARAYARRLAVTDTLAILSAVGIAQAVWFGFIADEQKIALSPASEFDSLFGYSFVSFATVVAWSIALELAATRDPRVMGIGVPEYSRIVDASIRLFGLVAVLAFLLKIDLSRGYILTAFPVGLLLLLVSRWAWRHWLVQQRKHGRMSARTLVVGNERAVSVLHSQFTERFPHAGYQLVGACLPAQSSLTGQPPGLPRLGGLQDVPRLVTELGVDVVIVTGSDELSPQNIKDLSWKLERTGVDLAVSPSLLDIVGPRVHTRSVAGMPLVHVDVPRYEGSRAAIKSVFDRTGALAFVLVFLPVFAALAICVRFSDPGPIFFRQERIGRNGKPFAMLKFRSMVKDAPDLLDSLLEHNESDAGVLFKLKSDPRVTAVGRVMRRHSLDELPQFFNVLRGDMSLVGPRPPLAREVEKYESHVLRRFLVKPGLTGPWQVSGRSELSWDESVRLDLYYVENWSLVGDFMYLWRTVKVVVTGRGGF
jgi:exopolysaccharide biosynthesis polyprenyl glycosylphosphotransferase